MKSIAVIPARGGSKRIPRKNIKPFAGKPIIAYSITAARVSGLFDRVMVSTDDIEIADIAQQFGAEVPFLRPKELADDHTGTNAVVKHVLNWYKDIGEIFDFACCIYATAPFVTSRYLKEGYAKLTASDKSFALSVTSFPFPVQRALRITRDGCLEALYPENNFRRSQDLEEIFHDAGQFCWGKTNAFLNGEIIFSPVSIPIQLPRHLVQDIDTLEDWTRAELMYSVMLAEQKG